MWESTIILLHKGLYFGVSRKLAEVRQGCSWLQRGPTVLTPIPLFIISESDLYTQRLVIPCLEDVISESDLYTNAVSFHAW